MCKQTVNTKITFPGDGCHVSILDRLHLRQMVFWVVAKIYLVQCKHDWTASERLRPESLSGTGRSTCRSGAEQQRFVPKIASKVAFLM